MFNAHTLGGLTKTSNALESRDPCSDKKRRTHDYPVRTKLLLYP